MPNVLITGCSSGIGRALADAFKAAGFEVWASARQPDDVAALIAAGFNALQLDVNDSAALQRLSEQWGELDVLINNAGYGAMGPLLDGGTEAMQRQFETNVFSIVGVTQALFPALRRNKGLVVNIGSVSRRIGDAVCRRLLRVQSRCACVKRRPAHGAGTVWRAGDGSSAWCDQYKLCKECRRPSRIADPRTVTMVAVARGHSGTQPSVPGQANPGQ